jgi:hypothetical protein
MRTELVSIPTDTLPLDGALYEPDGGAIPCRPGRPGHRDRRLVAGKPVTNHKNVTLIAEPAAFSPGERDFAP